MASAWENRRIREEFRLQVEPRMATVLQNRLLRESHRLALLEERVKASSPDVLLAKGYSITLKNGKAVTDPQELAQGDELVTKVYKGEFKSKVL